MNIKLRNAVIFAVSAVVAAAATYYFMRPTEEARVKAVFARVSETVSKSDGESLIVSATREKDIADLVAGQMDIWAPEQSVDITVSSSEVGRQATALRAMSSSLSMRFQNVRVTSVDGDVAHATARMFVSGAGLDDLLSGRDTWEVEAELNKSSDDGKWRFSSVSITDVAKK